VIKGQGFVLVLPPSAPELARALGACLLFTAAVLGLRARQRRAAADGEPSGLHP